MTDNKSKFVFYNEPVSTYTVPVFEKDKNKNWVNYGENNCYPQYLVDLFNRSAKHNAILTAKQKYTYGRGLKIKEGLVTEQAIKAQSFLVRPNNFETLSDIFNKAVLDKRIYGGYALQIVWSKLTGKVAQVYHMDFAKIRSNVDNTSFYYSDNWEDYRPKVTEYDAFNTEKREGVQILYYREYRPNLSTYPLPDYIGAIPYIESDVEVANFHRANLQNNFFFGGILNFNNGIPTDEEQRALVRRINNKHGSTDNAGRWIINFSDGSDKAPNVISLQPSELDKQFDILNDTIQQEIFVAHRVTSPIFMGIRVEGQLGGRNEMVDAFKLFEQNEIKPDQHHFEELFNYIIGLNGINQPYEVQPLEPFSPEFSEATMLEIATKDELREMAGLPSIQPVKDQNSRVVDLLGSFSPLLSTKVLEKLTDDEIRKLAGLGPLTQPLPTTPQSFSEENEIEVFAEFGVDADDYFEIESRKLEIFEDHYSFESHLEFNEQELYDYAFDIDSLTEEERSLISQVKRDPLISKKDLAVNLEISEGKLDELIKSLKDKKVLALTEGAWNIISVLPTQSAISKIADELKKYEVRYKYQGPRDSKNRAFCKALLNLNKLYTRDEISKISQRVGRNVWTKRGGWYTKPGTDIHLPYCRHQWASILVKKK
jgi:hypothetical protein